MKRLALAGSAITIAFALGGCAEDPTAPDKAVRIAGKLGKSYVLSAGGSISFPNPSPYALDPVPYSLLVKVTVSGELVATYHALGGRSDVLTREECNTRTTRATKAW